MSRLLGWRSRFGRFMPGAFDELTSTVAPISTVESRESGESREQTLLAHWQDMM